MSFWTGLGKVLGAAAPVVGTVIGGPIGAAAGSAAGGLLTGMASDADKKELYNQQLVYNSPKEQMKRLHRKVTHNRHYVPNFSATFV